MALLIAATPIYYAEEEADPMNERKKCMFDTVIFNRIVEHKVSVELLAECVNVYVTHVQHDEINATSCPEKKVELNQVFVDLAPKERPTESAVFDVSEWDNASFPEDDGLCEQIKAALDKCQRKKNNIQDALIAETAIKNNFTLVTDDRDLREEASKLGAECMSWEELRQLCRR